MANIEIEKDENNNNFEINKKFMSSLSQKNYLDSYKNLESQSKRCSNIFNLINDKKYDILTETKNEFNNMKNNYLKQLLNIYESDLDLSLKFAIDKFYESLPKKIYQKTK